VIVQNSDDQRAMTALPFVTENEVVLIPGSGTRIGPPPGAKDKLVLFPARMLYDKGAAEFAAAARRLKAAHPDWRFVMAGPWDYANPKAVPEAEVLDWQAAGIETPGFVADMAPLYAAAAIVCLPSYREGFPKALMEAAAAGAAVITTDAIGCRDAILPDMTGLQVPVADTDAVHDALTRLIADPDLTARLGAAGRAHAEAQFDETAIVARIYALYDELTAGR
jgi:glycosyltransferase involved in cell wall biosynthesis